jgi:hypothetical protein
MTSSPGARIIVAVAGDAGGANSLAPVIRRLRAEGRSVTALAYKQAVDVWRRRGVDCEALPEDTTPGGAAERLRGAQADVFLAGTSVNGVDLEKRFIVAARRLGIPSLAVLDFWSNYRARFADERGGLAYLPDRIAVMDSLAREEMIAAGFEPDRLWITGQPGFDELDESRRRLTPQRRAEVREALGIVGDTAMVLFASQPIAAFYGDDTDGPSHPGYTEHTVLAALVAALDRIAVGKAPAIALVVRPHPREDASALQRHRARSIRVIVDGRGDAREVALAADLVTGMSTVLLVEACLLGCVVASLQPGLRSADVLPTNRWGATQAVFRAEDLEGVVGRLLLDEEARREAKAQAARLQFEPGATDRVVRLIDSMQGSGSQN